MATIHGMSRTRTYHIWTCMKQRCFNPKHDSYKYYGAKGITVCNRWLNFYNFYCDMGEAPNKCSIDRIDNMKNYYLENCKWSNGSQQQQNKTFFPSYTYKNLTYHLSEWSRLLGISKYTLWYRLQKAKWPIEKAFNTSVLKRCV